MTETHQAQNSNVSVQSPETIQDGFNKMKTGEVGKDPYPDRPGEKACQFFLRTGHCGYGNLCRYNHPITPLPPQGVLYYINELPERIGEPDCEYFLKTGACKYGSTCKYHHPKDRNGAGPVPFNALGYPMRHGEQSCTYYMQTGMCKFGVACKFHHPQPKSLNGPTNERNNNKTTYGIPTFPYMMPLPPYPQASQLQPFIPFMVASSQGWPTYMGVPSNPIYNGENQPDSSSNQTGNKAECRFFMNTGTCKFGDDCKYSHPDLLHPVGLPSRPGQPECGNVKAYGYCKFGANCRFDHSMPLGVTMPSLPAAHASSDSNGKRAAENKSSEIVKEEDSPAQPEKPEVKDLSPVNCTTALSNDDKPDAENLSTESEKKDDSPAQPDSLLTSSFDSAALPNGKPDGNSHTETEEEEGKPAQQEDSEVKDGA